MMGSVCARGHVQDESRSVCARGCAARMKHAGVLDDQKRMCKRVAGYGSTSWKTNKPRLMRMEDEDVACAVHSACMYQPDSAIVHESSYNDVAFNYAYNSRLPLIPRSYTQAAKTMLLSSTVLSCRSPLLSTMPISQLYHYQYNTDSKHAVREMFGNGPCSRSSPRNERPMHLQASIMQCPSTDQRSDVHPALLVTQACHL